ncbi:MAG TPA: hypothetical protein VFZ24_10505, partial [Longimicrobiales bacterium]
WVVELHDALCFGITRGGTARGYTELPKHGIAEVSVRTPADARAYRMNRTPDPHCAVNYG